MANGRGVTAILIGHFFRRFFDNDTIQVEGDTVTTVVRAIAMVAAPGLMAAFFLQNQYPQRTLWGSIEDQYFFVLFSFVVMGGVSIFEWEMLFPDRLDFLILSPLSLRARQMLGAKAVALAGFLGLFLASCNGFGALVLPAVSKGAFWRQLYAHVVAVGLAGSFAALFFLALGGVLLCVLGGARFRMVAPVLQMLGVAGLALLMLHYLQYGDGLQEMLAAPLGRARWVPPFWFLGVYERLLHGDAAPAFAREMAGYAVRATWLAGGCAALTYPLAWARMRRLAVEGGSGRGRAGRRWVGRAIDRVVRRPGERAVFHFIGQTMRRNSRYQVYLAMYCGTGLALAAGCAVTLRLQGSRVHAGVSDAGMHAVLPLLLCWVIAGLRTAFGFPVNLAAGWVFRTTGVAAGECAGAARRWALVCAGVVMLTVLVGLRAVGWGGRGMLVQVVCGVCLAVMLTDGFFFLQKSVPFNQARMPGRTNLPLLLTLYVGVFPPFIMGAIYVARMMERSPHKLVGLALVTAGLHQVLEWLGRGRDGVEEEMEGYEGEFQLLGLS